MKLNHNVRVEILRNAMAHSFDKRQKALYKEENEVADKVYDSIVTPEMAKALKVLTDSGLHWFANQTILSFSDHLSKSMTMSKARPVPPWGRLPAPKGDALKLLKEFAAKREKFEEERKQVEKDLLVLLKSVHTTEALLKVWPEGHKFFSQPPLTDKSKIALPAKRVEELNKLLGLVA